MKCCRYLLNVKNNETIHTVLKQKAQLSQLSRDALC